MLANQLQHRGEVRHHAALEALSEAYAWIRETLRTWRQRIDERNRLIVLDDRMLQDIGLTRAEAIYLADKPFWRE